MEKKQIDELLAKYNEGLADPAEIKLIEQLIESGEVELTQLRELSYLDNQVQKMESSAPSMRLDEQFYATLASEKRKLKGQSSFTFSLPSWSALFPKLAMGTALILIGFSAGYFIQSPDEERQVSQLTEEVSELKEMMMLSLLEKESATDRLKAVSLTEQMDQASKQVTSALLQTLNNDENVSVRLAALDALRPYSKDGQIREALVRSIAQQKSPLVQVALAELMAELQEKGAIDAFKNILEDGETPSDIKKKIRENIQEI